MLLREIPIDGVVEWVGALWAGVTMGGRVAVTQAVLAARRQI